MNIARVVVLTIALSAGGVAAYLARGTDEKPRAAEPVAQLPTVEILVAKSDIALGQTVKPDDMQWQTWPAATASGNFINRGSKADAITEISGAIARAPFIAGEPIREQKLVKSNGSGFMAAILPTGMRGIATEISPDIVTAEIILTNVRVLTIDQAPKEKKSVNTLIGRTATLELKPEQAETLARARQSGTISLALRSITDANRAANRPEEQVQKRDNVNVVRYGIA